MKINVTQPLKELNGDPIMQETRCAGCIGISSEIHAILSPSAQAEMNGLAEEITEIVSSAEPLTLRLVINRSLMRPYQEDTITQEKSIERLSLAMRVLENDDVKFTSEEKVLIKERIVKFYRAPLIVARACIAIDSAMKPDK